MKKESSSPFCDQRPDNIPYLIELSGQANPAEAELMECGAKGKPSGLRIAIDGKYVYAVRPSYAKAPGRTAAIYTCAASQCSNAVLRATFDFVDRLVDSESIEIVNEYAEGDSDVKVERGSDSRADYMFAAIGAISAASPNFAFMFADMMWLCNRGFDEGCLDFAKAILPRIISADPGQFEKFIRDQAVSELTMAQFSSELTFLFLRKWLEIRGGGIFKDDESGDAYAIVYANKGRCMYDMIFGVWAVNACRMIRGERMIAVKAVGDSNDLADQMRGMPFETCYSKPSVRDPEHQWFFNEFYISQMSDDQLVEYSSAMIDSLKEAGFRLNAKMTSLAPFPLMMLGGVACPKGKDIRHMLYDRLNSDPDYSYAEFLCSLYDGNTDDEAELFAEVSPADLAEYDFVKRLSIVTGNGNHAIARIGTDKMIEAFDSYSECPDLSIGIKNIILCGMTAGGSPYSSLEDGLSQCAMTLTRECLDDQSGAPMFLVIITSIKSPNMKRIFAALAALETYMYVKPAKDDAAPGLRISDDMSCIAADPDTAKSLLKDIMSEIGKAVARSSGSFKPRIIRAFRNIVLAAGYRCPSFDSYATAAKAISASPISNDDAYALLTLHTIDPDSVLRPFMVTNDQLIASCDGAERIRDPLRCDIAEAILS